MLELIDTRASVVGAFAAVEALDALRPAGAYRFRVAPDEAMFVAPPSAGAALLRDASAVLAGDADAVVLDTSDGWAVWTIAGDAVRGAFARLSSLEVGEGYRQGDVVGVAGRVIAERDRIHLFVPAMWGHHLRTRALAMSPGIVPRGEPENWHLGVRR